jgi:asparagine synthase (glutamine-hydrolysing)
MFFGAYLGSEAQMDPWRMAVEQHATWLGLRFTTSIASQSNGNVFACAWLAVPDLVSHPHVQATGDVIEVGTRCDIPGGPPWQPQSNPYDTNEARLRMDVNSGELTVMLQSLSPEHVFYAPTTHSIALSNDLRLLIRMTGLDLDERAVFSLLQYGTVLPPFSISRQIQRIPNSHTLRATVQSDALNVDVSLEVALYRKPAPPGTNPATAVRGTMDGLLERVPRNSALFFSGGVDSGLMAARLAALGRDDVRLINFSFGPDDDEATLARNMAAHLGLRCEHITYDDSGFMDVLWRATEDYSFPFGDYSVMPMNMMIHAALGPGTQVPCLIDGSGADDMFSIGLKYPSWRRLYRLSPTVRSTVAGMYQSGDIWRRSSRTARVGRVVRRSAQLPLFQAGAMAQNSLDGIAYRTLQTVRDQLDDAFVTYRYPVVRQLPPADQFATLMTMNDSTGRVAPKSYDPLRQRGIRSYVPFLEPAMVRLALSLPWSVKSARGKPKSLLKGLLAEQVPSEMVYRRKSAFIPPYESILTSPPMQSYLREIVLSPSSPLAPFYDRGVVERMVEQTQTWTKLNLEVYFFLWTLTFTTAWLYALHAR